MSKLFTSKVRSFAQDKKGASLTEYAIVVGLIAIVAITAVEAFQGSVSQAFQSLKGQTDAYKAKSVPGAS
jgi:Flp pilus assembly pilin Flp